MSVPKLAKGTPVVSLSVPKPMKGPSVIPLALPTTAVAGSVIKIKVKSLSDPEEADIPLVDEKRTILDSPRSSVEEMKVPILDHEEVNVLLDKKRAELFEDKPRRSSSEEVKAPILDASVGMKMPKDRSRRPDFVGYSSKANEKKSILALVMINEPGLEKEVMKVWNQYVEKEVEKSRLIVSVPINGALATTDVQDKDVIYVIFHGYENRFGKNAISDYARPDLLPFIDKRPIIFIGLSERPFAVDDFTFFEPVIYPTVSLKVNFKEKKIDVWEFEGKFLNGIGRMLIDLDAEAVLKEKAKKSKAKGDARKKGILLVYYEDYKGFVSDNPFLGEVVKQVSKTRPIEIISVNDIREPNKEKVKDKEVVNVGFISYTNRFDKGPIMDFMGTKIPGWYNSRVDRVSV